MNEWWQSLSLAQQVFYGIAFIATSVLVVRIILGLIGADHGGDMAVEAGGDHDSGLGVLSLQTIATFMAGFGWGGVIWLNRGFGLVVAIIAGSIVGVVMMAGVVFLMRLMLRMRDSGTLDYHNAVGTEATAYCPIPPQRAAGGQVEVMCQSRMIFADAVSDAPDAIKTGARVRIVGVIGQSTFVVEPL